MLASWKLANEYFVIMCRQVAGSFGIVFAVDWPKTMLDIWLFISTVVQIDSFAFL
jgi:hypothetical protein